MGLHDYATDTHKDSLGCILEYYFDQELMQRWTDYSSTAKVPPIIPEILKFCSVKAQTSIPDE